VIHFLASYKNQVGLREFIDLQTFIGPGGIRLSGGQKQKIAIARAIISQPSVLLLDEAMSSLDPRNESIISHSLDKLMERLTSITITHNVKAIQKADRVLTLQEGKIIENVQQNSKKQDIEIL